VIANTPLADARGTILAMPGRSLMADEAPALASHQLSAGVVGVATEGFAFVRSTIASCARSRRWRRCSLRRWRLAYRSRTHSATGAFQGCCGDGWFFNRLRGLKPSSFAMRTSAGESRQRRAASAHALSIATFSAIGLLEPSLNAKRPARTGWIDRGTSRILKRTVKYWWKSVRKILTYSTSRAAAPGPISEDC